MRVIFTVFLCSLLIGCGIKPSNVKAPNTDKQDRFPRAYPDVNTDPKPKNKP